MRNNKKMRKILIYSFIPVVFVGVLVAGAISVQAEDASNYPPILQRIADRFNLNVDEVEGVVNEVRQEHNQNMEARFEGRLGDLSEEQREVVLAKMEEMREGWAGLKDFSPEERCIQMQERKEEMTTWAEENGINLGDLKESHKGFGKGFGLKGFRLGQ